MTDMTTTPYQQSLFELQARLAVADARVKQYARQAHMVGNCISDQERRTEAMREWQQIEYQIAQLIKNHSAPVDNGHSLYK